MASEDTREGTGRLDDGDRSRHRFEHPTYTLGQGYHGWVTRCDCGAEHFTGAIGATVALTEQWRANLEDSWSSEELPPCQIRR